MAFLKEPLPNRSARGNGRDRTRTFAGRHHSFQTTVELAHTVDRVFQFFCDAANLQRITPPQLDFQILSPLPSPMRKGAIIDYRLRLWGVRFRWRTRIAVWQPPHRFVDEQIRGPYAEWVHEHRFEPCDGGTRMVDHVLYRLRFWPLGELAAPWVRREVQRIFAFRRQRIPELL